MLNRQVTHQRLLEIGSCSCQARLDGSNGNSKHVRNLVIGEAFDIAKDYDRSMFSRQPPQRLLNGVFLFLRLECLLGSGNRCGYGLAVPRVGPVGLFVKGDRRKPVTPPPPPQAVEDL